MPGKESAQNKNIADQIEELRAKLQLLDGDKKAYYESATFAMKKNSENIQKLRKENKELRKTNSDRMASDSHLIKASLKEHKRERNALREKTGPQAIEIMDHKVCDARKKLNRLRHDTVSKQRRLEELQTQYDQMVKDSSEAVATDTGESEEAQKTRDLENRLDKAKLKCQEAEHICKTYLQIKAKLEEEHKSFENTLDDMETEIREKRNELKQLELMKNDAILAKEAAVSELRKNEEIVYSERKRREIELQKMKKEAEEKKMQHERIDRRIAAQRGSLTQDDLSPQERQALTGEEQQQKITTYEEAFKRIKEATGVSDTQEVVLRFENQGDTQEHLEDLKKDYEKQINRLREDKEKLKQEFEEMKYTGESKLSSGQRLLEECEGHLKAEEDRRDEAQDRLERTSKILASVKGGVEHLADKLKNLKAPQSQVQKAKIPPSSDEYVLDQLSISEEKLLKLLEELDGKNTEELLEQMSQEEFHNTAEHKLPTYNTRVKLPQTQRDNVYDDDDESGDDEGDILTRQNIKRQSQQLVDSKTKRKIAKRKKKTK